MTMSRIILTLLLLVNMATLKSQLTSELQLTAGKLRLNLNDQLGGWTHNSLPFIEWQLEDGSYVPMMTAGGPWIMGRKPNGEIVGAYLDGENESPETTEVTSSLPGFWQVSKQNISAHFNDYNADQDIDERIASIYSWPGEGNPYFEEYNGFPLPELDAYPSYWDNNSDGIYNPDDGDYPLPIKTYSHPNPPKTFAEFAWSTYSIRFDEYSKLTIGASYQVYECDETSMNVPNRNFAMIVYDVLNEENSEDIIDLIFGIKANAQIGRPSDDYAGSDSLTSTGYFYNSSVQDSILDQNPPAFGLSLRHGFIDPVLDENGNQIGFEQQNRFGSIMPQLANAEIPGMQLPANREEFYHYLFGNWKDGRPLEYGNDGYDESTYTAKYSYSNLSDGASGWSEYFLGNEPGPRILLMSSQPSYLEPRERDRIAWIISATDVAENHLAQVDSLLAKMTRVKDAIEADAIGDNLTDCENPVSSTDFMATNFTAMLFPNPVADQLSIAHEGSDGPFDITVFDATGREVISRKQLNIEEFIDLTFLVCITDCRFRPL